MFLYLPSTDERNSNAWAIVLISPRCFGEPQVTISRLGTAHSPLGASNRLSIRLQAGNNGC